MNREGFEFSFAWLFAIIVGVVIIFIAIYFTTSIVGNSRYEADTKVAAQLETILNPVQTSVEEGRFTTITFPVETRIFNDCSEFGDFGQQSISTAGKSGIGREWQEPGARINSKDKYIFSEDIVQGQEAYVFVKPFEMPYKVGDVMMIYSKDYCFVRAFDDIEEEVRDLGLPGIQLVDSIDECPTGSESVCFGSGNCDVVVNQEELVYAKIFSSPEIYECQLKRLMKRNSQIALLYAGKSEFLDFRGCSSGLGNGLIEYSNLLNAYEDSGDLEKIRLSSENLEGRNELLKCKLF